MSAGAQVDASTLPGARHSRYWLDRESVLGPLLLLPAVVYIVALVGIVAALQAAIRAASIDLMTALRHN